MTTALLVIDMQSFFAPMTKTCLPNIHKLISHFSSLPLPRIFTQHGHSTRELTPPYPNQLVRKWGPEGSIAVGSSEWQFIPSIGDAVKEAQKDKDNTVNLVAKNTYDAFINTDLEAILRGRGVERVVVCGVMTDCCCDTTARAAFNRGFETLLVDDACGSADKQQHQAGLKGFGFAFGEVLKTSDVVKRIKE